MVDELNIIKFFNTILITGVIYGFIFNAYLFFSKKERERRFIF